MSVGSASPASRRASSCTEEFSSPLLQASHPFIKPPANLFSQPTTSSQAPSLRKLCTGTRSSTAVMSVSAWPLRRRALYICCGEGYSHLDSPSLRGMDDSSREVGSL